MSPAPSSRLSIDHVFKAYRVATHGIRHDPSDNLSRPLPKDLEAISFVANVCFRLNKRKEFVRVGLARYPSVGAVSFLRLPSGPSSTEENGLRCDDHEHLTW